MLTRDEQQRVLDAARRMAMLRVRHPARVRRGDISDKSFAASMQKAEDRFMDFLKEIEQ